MEELVENKFIQFWREEEIIVGRYKKDVFVSLEVAKEIVELRRENYKGKFLWLLYIENFSIVTPEAREYFASSYANENVIKWAFIPTNSFSIVLSNIFISFNKPIVPIKLFKDKKAAIEWLRS